MPLRLCGGFMYWFLTNKHLKHTKNGDYYKQLYNIQI